MTLETLKQTIESRSDIDGPIIFIFKDTDYVATQYVHAFSDYMNLDICSIEALSDMCVAPGMSTYVDQIYLYRADDISDISVSNLKNTKHLFIITSSSKISDKGLSEYIINIPKLEQWQIRDYINTNAPRILADDPNFPVRCDWDMHIIENEVAKYSIFGAQSSAIVSQLYKQADMDGCLNYLNKYSIYDIITAVLKKDAEKLSAILKYDTEKFFTDPEGKENYFGFLTLLYNSVKDIINVTIGVNITPLAINMQPGKFWAIKNNYSGIWTKRQLEKILLFLTSVDENIRSGKLPMNMSLFYYIVVTIFEMEE